MHTIKQENWVLTTNIGQKEFDVFRAGHKYFAYLSGQLFKVFNSKKDMTRFFRFESMKSLLL
jgi:hypothetical protein